MNVKRVQLVVAAPAEAVEQILDAISNAGGGIIGEYTHCAYTSTGTGHFKPSGDASPHIGTKQAINTVDEVRIETFCDRDMAKAVVSAIREAHPYEEPVIYIVPLLAEEDL
ncbi:MAG: hypothetical protein D6737_16885 [Chloroflexi bacterium]|nr:MAG: hypothetical protein CUN54_04375 [Phototrophicales bacterium]RMF77735.1 MAG: hypothetical protein D6737_16885 [Chloroflexota bacterium]